jgi:hypothetical protein
MVITVSFPLIRPPSTPTTQEYPLIRSPSTPTTQEYPLIRPPSTPTTQEYSIQYPPLPTFSGEMQSKVTTGNPHLTQEDLHVATVGQTVPQNEEINAPPYSLYDSCSVQSTAINDLKPNEITSIFQHHSSILMNHIQKGDEIIALYHCKALWPENSTFEVGDRAMVLDKTSCVQWYIRRAGDSSTAFVDPEFFVCTVNFRLPSLVLIFVFFSFAHLSHTYSETTYSGGFEVFAERRGDSGFYNGHSIRARKPDFP